MILLKRCLCFFLSYFLWFFWMLRCYFFLKLIFLILFRVLRDSLQGFAYSRVATIAKTASRVVKHKLRIVGKISQSPTSFVLLFFLIHRCLILLISIFFHFLRFLFGSRCLWLSGISGSIAYNWSRPNMKTGVKIIHARFISYNFLSFPILFLT